jgi:hypothetical protein
VEYESVAVYFNKLHPLGFELETSDSDAILGYYAPTSGTQKVKLMGKSGQFTYTSTQMFSSTMCCLIELIFSFDHYLVLKNADMII